MIMFSSRGKSCICKQLSQYNKFWIEHLSLKNICFPVFPKSLQGVYFIKSLLFCTCFFFGLQQLPFRKRRKRVVLSRRKAKICFLVTNSVLLRCMGAAVPVQPAERAAWRAPAGLSCPAGYASIKRLEMSLKSTGQEKRC